jgi:hypothetical protein
MVPLTLIAARAGQGHPRANAQGPLGATSTPGASTRAATSDAALQCVAAQRQLVKDDPVKLVRPVPIARHVIIISEDGLRPDALIKANGTVHGSVMRQGSYSLEARTIRHASTLPSHAAMLSGFDEPTHKLSWNAWKPERGYIQVPTVFDAAHHAGLGSAAFVGKQKLEHIAHPGSVDVFSRPGFFCKKVVEEAARYFIEKHPQVEFVHFSDPDERGHAVGWMSEPQIEAIRHTDRCLATMIDAVRTAGLEDTTLFILSADHGGHGRNHSGRISEDRLIPWLAWGAGVRRGHIITSAISTMDTAATVLWALGYPATPDIQGRPVREAFDEPREQASHPPPARSDGFAWTAGYRSR